MAMRYYAPLPGGGDPFWPRGPQVMRIGDAERDAAAADLGEHFTAGRLTSRNCTNVSRRCSRRRRSVSSRGSCPICPGRGGCPGWPGSPGTGDAGHARPAVDAGPRARLQLGGRVGRRDARLGHGLGPGRIPAGLGVAGRARGPATGCAVPASPADRAGKFAALSLLILAMLIWLFTALLFARHGVPAVGPIAASPVADGAASVVVYPARCQTDNWTRWGTTR